MPHRIREYLIAAAMALMLLVSLAGPAFADERTHLVIDAQVLGTSDVATSQSTYSLAIQGSSWIIDGTHAYVLTVTNFTPWQIPALSVLDRYMPLDPDAGEHFRDWFPDLLEPGQAAAMVVTLPGPWQDACHQIEISIAEGLSTILMDCSQPGNTTIWDVPLTSEMVDYLSAPIPEPMPVPLAAGPSKVGIHVTRNSAPSILEYVDAAQPAVVAAVGDLGWLAAVKERSPGTVTLGRLIEGDQSISGDPVERARAYVQEQLVYYQANTGVDYWLGWNEPVIDDAGQMAWFQAFEAERIVRMAEHGFKVAIGNFSAGTPEADEFEAFLPVFAVAKAHGAVLALHEYSAPTLLDGVGSSIPGFDSGHGSGALTLRYRFWYEHYLRPNDLVIPLVITEAGIDGGVLRVRDENLLGWRDFQWADRLPEAMPPQSADGYLEQLSWYDDQLRQDPYVLGFAIFNVGEEDGKWASFDMTDMLPDLANLAINKR